MIPVEYVTFSHQAIIASMGVLALAFLAHVIEWGFARKVVHEPVAVGAGAVEDSATDQADQAEEAAYRVSLFGRIAVAITVVGTLVLSAGVITRALAIERAPWGNMYEFGTTGAALLLIGYLIMLRPWKLQWMGIFVTGFSLATVGFSTTLYVPPGPLVPSLNSAWLIIHVAAVMLAGILFVVGAALSIAFLLRERYGDRGAFARLPNSESIDQLSFKIHAVAFPIWTFGALIAGPIWAQEAWGRYWDFDPKEVWALITWIVYAGYLHARLTAGWKGKRAAYIAIAGFGSFLINYYGVNLFASTSIHSYAQ